MAFRKILIFVKDFEKMVVPIFRPIRRNDLGPSLLPLKIWSSPPAKIWSIRGQNIVEDPAGILSKLFAGPLWRSPMAREDVPADEAVARPCGVIGWGDRRETAWGSRGMGGNQSQETQGW